MVVIGNTCAGKTTFGEQLARKLSVPLIDLDALYWNADWKPRHLDDFRSLVGEATKPVGWVLAGNYSKQWDISWARADTVVWLDVALPVIVGRIVSRSYRRWRSNEVLWGTNRERFFPQFRVWDKKSSLIAWAVLHHADKRQEYESAMKDERWRHIAFHRFRSNTDADQWAQAAR